MGKKEQLQEEIRFQQKMVRTGAVILQSAVNNKSSSAGGLTEVLNENTDALEQAINAYERWRAENPGE